MIYLVDLNQLMLLKGFEKKTNRMIVLVVGFQLAFAGEPLLADLANKRFLSL